MMNNRINVFFNNLIIDKDDMPRAMRNLKSKGIEKHIIIKDKLMAYSESGMVRYTQIASIYRYDKRLRIVLYKYISFLEEWYRSIILDNYINKTKKMFKTEDLKEKLEEKSNLNDALEKMICPLEMDVLNTYISPSLCGSRTTSPSPKSTVKSELRYSSGISTQILYCPVVMAASPLTVISPR